MHWTGESRLILCQENERTNHMNPPLIDPEALRVSQEKYFSQHPTPAIHLLAYYREHPGASVTEMARASGYGKSWVRKILRDNGIALPGHKGRQKVNAATPCARCQHVKGGPAAMNARQPSHCPGGVIHRNHWSHPVPRWICEGPHCCVENCDCGGFEKP
jgi:hypothetical protein